jgi:crossover junction endodeoxyribonuclease RusA
MADLSDKPMEVVLTFYFPRPQSHYGTGRNAHILKPSAPDYPTKPPDIDKLMRAIFDGATDAGLWLDDAQVVDVHAIKMWARQRPGVSLTVYPKGAADADHPSS